MHTAESEQRVAVAEICLQFPLRSEQVGSCLCELCHRAHGEQSLQRDVSLVTLAEYVAEGVGYQHFCLHRFLRHQRLALLGHVVVAASAPYIIYGIYAHPVFQVAFYLLCRCCVGLFVVPLNVEYAVGLGKCAFYLFRIVLLSPLYARHVYQCEGFAVNLQVVLAINFSEVGSSVAHNHSVLCVARLGACLRPCFLVCQNAHCLYECALARISLSEEGNHQLVPHGGVYRLLRLCAVFADKSLECCCHSVATLLQRGISPAGSSHVACRLLQLCHYAPVFALHFKFRVFAAFSHRVFKGKNK